nr:insulinase family protein [Desulfobacterales bacterium]
MSEAIKKTVLKNGMRIITEKIQHVRSISMGVWVNVGGRDEGPKENGISHFIEHMIFKGTRRRTAFQIAKEFDAIGGLSNAFTSKEFTCFHAKVMDSHFNIMVDLLADILLNSVFDPVEVEKERQVILQEIRLLEDTPDDYVHVLLGEAFWGDNPLGRSILGNLETISSFDSETIKNYFRRAYQPEHIVISAAGNLEHEYFLDVVSNAFQVSSDGFEFPDRIIPETQSRITIQRKDLEQVHICLGVKGVAATDPRRYACSLLNIVLGGGMSSRLFQEIREQRGLAYTINSFLSIYEDCGMLGIYMGTDTTHTEEAIDVIIKELKSVKERPVDESELSRAKEHLKGSLFLSLENTDTRMTRLAHNEFYYGRHIPIEEVVENIEKTTSDKILELAQELFSDENLSLVLLGPVDEKIKTIENIGL